ncbi:DUF6318 family protein [Nocardioides sp. R1-1]|uniref:DUF6318 family protein n=1 Tax=Nocardioides sp. R1-1 TaxID=3383502 RepID=UPI0038D047C3
MRRLRALVALVLLIVGVTACSDDEPAPHDPSSTWSPTGTMEAPSSTAAAVPIEPRLPDAAREASEAGARAFIAYYWELVNYAQVTGDVKALKAVSGTNCKGCAAGIEGIRTLYRDGGRLEGGDYDIEFKVMNELKDADGSGYAFEAKLTASTGEQTKVDGDGRTTRIPAGSSDVVVVAAWLGSGWRLEAMQLS